MRAALVVNKVVSDVSENMRNIIGYINKAADNNVDLVMFSETALTGFSMTDNPKKEQEDYINRLKQIETKAFLVNYLDKEYFGGTFVLSSEGKLLASLELGKEGTLFYDF